MSAPRIVVTTNGPGELMGWTRPFVNAVYALAPDADVTIVFVPCPYATGHEADAARILFPRATVVDPKSYARFLLNKPVDGMQRGPGALQYLGGDLFHATTIARRLGLAPMTYKFSKRTYAQSFVRFFALDERNAAALRRDRTPTDRIRVVGNLVGDAVLDSLRVARPPDGVGDGVVVMPGSRPPEIKYALPFFLAAALELHRMRPALPIAFVLSPFNRDDELRASLSAPPDKRMPGVGGTLSDDGRTIDLGEFRVAVDRSADYGSMAQAQLIVTIPGTKCIEAAILGRPTLAVVPLNRMDDIVIPGLAGYLHLVPVVGRPLKVWMARAIEKRWKFLTQPNIDAGREVMPELRGVLQPTDVATAASSMLDDRMRLALMGETLAALYAGDRGAAKRMAGEAIAIAESAVTHAMRVAL